MFREQKSNAKNYKHSRIRWIRADNLRPRDLVFDTQGKPWVVDTITIQKQNNVTGSVGVKVEVYLYGTLQASWDLHFVHAQTQYRTQRFIPDEALAKRARRAQNK